MEEILTKSFNVAVVVVAVGTLLSACATNEQNRRAGNGALVGAGVGAVAGQAIGRNTRSTVGGAAGGALLGAVVGTASTPSQDRNQCRYRRNDGTIYIAPC
jgi:outer membrane lipoprotein SlyB